MTIREITGKMKMAAPMLAAASCEQRNQALAAVKEALLAKREAIFEANRKDLEQAQQLVHVEAPCSLGTRERTSHLVLVTVLA